ncbi:peptidylprolyl isomerase [Lignipirellula cremea]|uniref:Periplasmic chaperone PpiD n=1 Tax=Lignipirellula cremea TaxID=2528010 RepID=A0A518E2D0_9BACT|nr:peptidylprolyl isomerase [Lignipirellula cremea]QDU98256.1 Foldase protein PrsA precursor [Lignipirellula cremea]
MFIACLACLLGGSAAAQYSSAPYSGAPSADAQYYNSPSRFPQDSSSASDGSYRVAQNPATGGGAYSPPGGSFNPPGGSFNPGGVASPASPSVPLNPPGQTNPAAGAYSPSSYSPPSAPVGAYRPPAYPTTGSPGSALPPTDYAGGMPSPVGAPAPYRPATASRAPIEQRYRQPAESQPPASYPPASYPPQPANRFPAQPSAQSPTSYPPPQQQPPSQPTYSTASTAPLPTAPGPAPPGVSPSAPANPASRAAQESAESLYSPARIVARIGNQTILAGDLLGTINQMLEPYEGKVPEEQLEAERQKLMQQLLERSIETKLVYNDFLSTVPDENLPQLEKAVREAFMAQRLPELIERAKVANAAELDNKLRGYGASIDKTIRVFQEQVLAQQHLRRQVDTEAEVTHAEMLTYYREHAADYDVPAKARWERLMVRFTDHPSPQAARQAIAQMGNEVVGGAQFAVVAKRSSQGSNASKGGYHDWTTRGSLASEALDEAIFTLPIGKLSQIIEDRNGYHIIRVIERIDDGQVSFVDAQPKIKDAIKNARVQKQQQDFLAELRAKTYVWTVFDDKK